MLPRPSWLRQRIWEGVKVLKYSSTQILATKGRIVPTGLPQNGQDEKFCNLIDWRQSMKLAIRSASELRRRLGLPEADEATKQVENEFPTFVSLEFLARIEPGNPRDPLLRQVLAIGEEMIEATGFVDDPVGDERSMVAPGLLQKYAKRALVIATGVCGIHCRYCFRREFDYSIAESNPPTSPNVDAWEPAVNELRERVDIDEVILSGGDPLTLSDPKLGRLISAIESIPHVKRLRIHSRMPIVIPQRVTDELLVRLKSSRLATWMVVHCNHVAEIDAAVEASIARMVDTGIPVLNQAVLLRGVNDSVDALESLCRRLVDLRVQPYYLHQLDRVRGAAHFEVPIAQGKALIEQLRERLPGYAIPRYAMEEAGKKSKTAL